MEMGPGTGRSPTAGAARRRLTELGRIYQASRAVERGQESVEDLRYLQGTYDGASDSSGRRQLVEPGSVIYVVWAGGPPNAVATFRASGLAYPAGQGRANM